MYQCRMMRGFVNAAECFVGHIIGITIVMEAEETD